MRTEIQVSIFDVIIFLGVFQGLLLSWFFIRNADGNRRSNLFQGLLLLSLSVAIFEEWLNNTGYIVKVLYLTNFSESLNFAFAPLFYFYIWSSLNPSSKRNTWVHFIPVFFWALYMVFHFVQPDELKYNSYVQTKHPDWEYLIAPETVSDDPLGIRRYVNHLMLLQFFIYISWAVVTLLRKFRSMQQPLFRTDNELLRILRNSTLHILILITIMIITKINFGMRSDVGGYFIATYVSFMIYATTWQIMSRSEFFDTPGSFFSFPAVKYQKSSLSEENKEVILKKIKHEMEANNYFTNNLASLSGLSKQINESSHHVSQVMNEKLNRNFFELLAFYRVEHAKKLITQDKDGKITIEELAEMVGYNSKSSFNTAFRKHTSKTPSEFRKKVNS
ncbi:MAG: helix-turn-helix domain-containing protein [Bacteroidales bacterium]|jgi:AraC-like DNA-binding protein|nr:helix-turn-helix domain-containing protein [Bacteroidales bacterium]